jgi:hypothetical protein
MRQRHSNLPSELTSKVASAERKDRRIALLLSVAGLGFAVCAAFLPFLLIERLWSTPGIVRALFLAGAVGGIGWFVARWVAHRVRSLRDPFATIRRIERHYPDLGDSLRGVVELSERTDGREGVSESLRQAAVRQVAKRCEALEFTEAIPTSRLWVYVRRTGMILAVLLIAAVIEPELVRNGLARFVRPWSPIPRYTFARLAPLPGLIRVPQGEPFSIPVSLAENSRWTPERLRFRLGTAQPELATMQAGQAVLELPGITEPTRLGIRLGDTRARVAVQPVPRPALLDLTADVTLPAYLERPAQAVECARQRPRLVEGSRVVLHGSTLNPLAKGWFDGEEGRTPFVVAGNSFTSPDTPVEQLVAGTVGWQDENGFSPEAPYTVEIDVMPDGPPGAQLQSSARSAAILDDEALSLTPRATDDYGVKTVDVVWEVYQGYQVKGDPIDSGQREVGRGGPDVPEWAGEFVFSAQRLGIKAGSTVVVRTRAVDYKPGRTPSESEPVTVFVMTPQDHARLVQRQLDALRNRMEEAALREAEQLLANERLAKMSPEELRTAEAQKELAKQAELEKKSVEDWKRLTEEAAKLLGEATRNEEFPTDVLKEWTETMAAAQDVASELLPQASQALNLASQSAEQRKENLEKATEAQRKALERLKQAAEDMGKSLEQFAVLNMAARLRVLAGRERQVNGALQELFPQTIGMSADSLPVLLANQVKGVGKTQADVQKLVFEMQFEIQRYLENTGIEKYGKVLEAMEAAKLQERMPAVVVAVQDNRLVAAIGQTQEWAKALDEWAQILDEKKDGGGGGGGGGGGEMSEEAMEFMLAILRAVQNQEQLRRDTRALDAEKEQIKDYVQQAERLSVAEAELGRTLDELALKLRPSEALNTVEDAQTLMQQAALGLRKPDTGLDVRANMSSAMELLLSLFDSNCSGGKCQGSAMMAMMAQKMGLRMGMSSGMSGGGSRAGGPFNGAGGAVTGGAGSGSSAERGGDSVTDVAPAEFPAEYRGLLETFFQKVEAADE